MEFSIHRHDTFFEIVTFGDAEVEAFRDILEALVTHAQWETGTPMLIDLTHLNAAPLAIGDMNIIAGFNAQYSRRLGESKCAVLAINDLEYGMGRAWETFVENKWQIETKLFKSRDAAIVWLTRNKED